MRDLTSAFEAIAGVIKEAQDNSFQLGEIRATLLVNFGPTSLSMHRYGFQIDKEGLENTDKTINILSFVLTKLIDRGNRGST